MTMKKELNVYEDFIGQMIDKFQNHIDGVKYRTDIFPIPRNIQWIRINHCQAWFTRINDMIFIKSYGTIVALFDGDTLYSNGRYSNTTYQHIRKFKNDYTPQGYNTKETNLERCNWY